MHLLLVFATILHKILVEVTPFVARKKQQEFVVECSQLMVESNGSLLVTCVFMSNHMPRAQITHTYSFIK